MALNSNTPLSTTNGNTTVPINTQPVVNTPPVTVTNDNIGNIDIVPGVPQGDTNQQINVADLASQLVTDPSLIVSGNSALSTQVPQVTQEDVNSGLVNTATTNNAINGTATQATNVATANNQTQADTPQVTAATTADQVAANDMTAAQGTVSDQAQINPNDVPTLDTNAIAAGQTGTGQALNEAAQQGLEVVDTSTIEGKIRAAQLGQGNYVDSQATVKGQLDKLSTDFKDANGDPVIPSWAAGTARAVGRIAAFSGMTGTAATAAMAQAIQEASISVATKDAQFFQTATLQNLSNRQESTINKANVLSKMDMANLDNRMAAAVQNAQAFMQMDMANLSNEQQAQVINTQDRVQSILEDAKAENTARLFVSDSQNQRDMFYSNLNGQIDQFNAAQTNNMAQFNTDQVNSMEQFNKTLDDSRDKFYSEMQYNIDVSNAKWRQALTMNENQQQFEAASTDVKNMVGLSVEELNRIWDRADSLLDYVWKSGENEADRKSALAIEQYKQTSQAKQQDQAGIGSIIGTIVGAGADALFGWLFK